MKRTPSTLLYLAGRNKRTKYHAGGLYIGSTELKACPGGSEPAVAAGRQAEATTRNNSRSGPGAENSSTFILPG